MKPEEIRELTDDQLFERASQLRESIFRQRFRLQLGNQDVVRQIRADRRDLARVKTELRAREVRQEVEAGTRPARANTTRDARRQKAARAQRAASRRQALSRSK
jgi:large subunit ribosomal protein L29